jgi:predicted cupin superfamily sugar epimerase
MTAREVIELLGLQKHPVEGGYFVETYRSGVTLPAEVLPDNPGPRSLGTAIYYLLTPDTFSAMHRLPTDEVFHFYMGDPVEMLQLPPDGPGRAVRLGNDLAAGDRPQVVVPGGHWQGASLAEGGSFALLGTTMAPGFDYDDYQTGDRAELTAAHPEFAERITRLTRP